MKTTTRITLCLLMGTLFLTPGLQAQNSSAGKPVIEKVGVYFTPLGSRIVLGDGHSDKNEMLAVGVSYSRSLNRVFSFETGLEYIRGRFVSRSCDPGEIPHDSQLDLLSIPIGVKGTFGKYFFINGGTLFDLGITSHGGIDSQTGLGAMLGMGLQCAFGPRFTAYVNPYLRWHALIPFDKKLYHEHLTEAGIRFGLTYTLGK